jgi:hypothetical protein
MCLPPPGWMTVMVLVLVALEVCVVGVTKFFEAAVSMNSSCKVRRIGTAGS